MMPTIFNDVIGPVMRGPSSSHTAASHRIGAIIRQVCFPEYGKVLVEFDRKGSLATTYEGQGSAMGLTCGLLGVSMLDPNVVRYTDLAKERNLNIRFQVTDFENSHPNTYRILVENNKQEQFQFIAVSTGGGMIEVKCINGFDVSIKGDYFEILVYCISTTSGEIQKIFQDFKNNTDHSEIKLFHQNSNSYLINIKSRKPFLKKVNSIINKYENVNG